MSFLTDLADALQAPLRGIACFLNPSAFGLGVGLPPSFNASLVWPTDCGAPRIGEENPVLQGQCVGVLYNVLMRRIAPDGTTLDFPFSNVVGPIRSAGNRWTGDFSGNLRHTVTLAAPNDTEGPTPGIRQFGPSSYTDNGRLGRSVIVSITRVDGLPDNCTDTTPPTPPPSVPITVNLPDVTISIGGSPITFNGPVTIYNPIHIPVYGGIHIPINFRVNPNIIFPGGINLPIYLRLPDLNINPSISFFNVDLGGLTVPIDLTLSFPQTPTGEENAGIDYVERIVGVDIRCSVAPSARLTEVRGDGVAPDLYVPRLAVVRFTLPSFLSSLPHIDIDVKSINQFVTCPFPTGATGFTVLPQPGVTYTATPITAQVANLVKAVP